MNRTQRAELRRAANTGLPVSPATARAVLAAEPAEWPEIMAAAGALRCRFFGNRVQLCSILNARSGACGEDCAFCAQSARHATGVPIFRLRSPAQMRAACRAAARRPIGHFGIVTSGRALAARDVDTVCRAVSGGRSRGVAWCASLGGLCLGELRKLRRAGVRRYHHNLETAPSFFPQICSTHTFADRLRTVRAARAAGLETCCGGIFGMGESPEQRVELAMVLARERVDSIPLNFLMPRPGTPLEKVPPLTPLEILKCITMVRLLNPRAEIKVCAGRAHLRSLQPLIFLAGASGMMIGDLLTVPGTDVEADLRMVADLGLEPARG